MYNEGPEIPDEGVRAVALGIIAQLAQCDTVRLAMSLDHALCTAVLMAPPEIAAEEPQPDFVRQRGWFALCSIVIAGACSKNYEREDGGTDAADGLILGLQEEQAPIVRAGIFGALWSTALTPEVDRRGLWQYQPLREAMLTSTAPGVPSLVRQQAMGLLWALTAYPPNRELIWHDREARDMIIKGAAETWDPVFVKVDYDAEEKEEEEPVKDEPEADSDNDKSEKGDEG
jgi:hypothetical protein